MVNITLSVPDDLKKDMEIFPEINWSVIARAAIKQRIVLLKKFKEFSKESTLTQEDAIRLGKQVNESVTKKYLKKLK
ncbi:hypothetical protein LDC_1635 [sediment metagenome]|uniref:CopG family transcriptional regulator n=1 Tax=sediment metagenome TaxID=749907 RepID=D9PJC6_9ZZZZ